MTSSPLEAVDGRQLDVLVLGGGITGAATARELAWRGFSVLLVEPRDVAWGTSGRSSRLVHGGLRYLASGHLRLVRQSLRARLDLVRAAPHLVRPCPFVVPLARSDPGGWHHAARWGVKLYDLLSRPRRGWPAPREVTRNEARTLVPGLDPGGFKRAILYHDGWTDDRRLTLVTALDARRAGATLATRCEPLSISAAADGRARVVVRDRLSAATAAVDVRAFVNATGAWVDRVRERFGLEGARTDDALVRPTRGAHLAVAGRIDGAALLRHPRDGRVVFLVPGPSSFIVGTTDEDDGRPPDEISATQEDDDYLAELLAHVFPEGAGRVRAAFAGLRPLVNRSGDPDTVSRRSKTVVESLEGVPLISVVGGKLTLHRPMAEKVADLVERRLGSPDAAERTPQPRLPGGEIASVPGEEAAARASGLTPLQARWMVGRYGSLWRDVLAAGDAGAETLGGGEIPLAAELAWALREENVRTASDLLLRFRIPEVVDDDARVAESVIARLAALAGWGPARVEREHARWQRERSALYGIPDREPLGTP